MPKQHQPGKLKSQPWTKMNILLLVVQVLLFMRLKQMEKEIKQGDESYTEEPGDSEEAKTRTAIRAPRPAVDTNDKQKIWSLASGKTDMIRYLECPSILQHQNIKWHFNKNHKELSIIYRICQGIPGVPYCQEMVSHWTLGKHFNQHIQQRNILIESKRRQKFRLFQRLSPQQPFSDPPTPFLAPSPTLPEKGPHTGPSAARALFPGPGLAMVMLYN